MAEHNYEPAPYMGPTQYSSVSNEDTDATDPSQRKVGKQSANITHGEPSEDSANESTSLLTVYKRWAVELLACLVAILALLAIIILLGTHNGRTLPNWPFGISVNALVSIFAVIFKGAMMVPVAESIGQLKWSWFKEPRPLNDLIRYDSASRGTWGSIRLIGRLRGLHLASLGAAITILAVASDPFIQQVVKYHPCPQIASQGTALLARTNNYNLTGIRTGPLQQSLDLPMQVAIFEGAFDSFSPIQATCTTGNCTFGDFRTAAMCSSCEDISSTINITCPKSVEQYGCAGECIWQLYSGLNLTLPTNGKAMEVGTNLTADDQPFLVTTSMMWFEHLDQTASLNCSALFPKLQVKAASCSLYPCVRTFDTTVSGGKTVETLLSTSPMSPNGTYPGSPWLAVPMPCLINGTYYDSASFTKQNATNTINATVTDENNKNVTLWVPRECVFTYLEPLGLQQYLPEFLAGHVEDAIEDDFSDSAWLGQLYHGGNVTISDANTTWATIADSMTVHMRQSADGFNLQPLNGEAQHTETCISVQWPWLAFPASLLVLSVVFLIATVLQSIKYSRKQMWKSSPLALLFHGLNHDLRDRAHLGNTDEEMKRAAQGLLVKLSDEEKSSRFVEAFSSKSD